jgi:hypothetical protein
MQDAFDALRRYARASSARLSEVARAVADGTADLDAILPRAPRRVSRRGPGYH